MALSENGNLLVTGSKDTTAMVWEVGRTEGDIYVNEQVLKSLVRTCFYLSIQPKYVLFGHDDEITSVAISSDFEVIITGSSDGN